MWRRALHYVSFLGRASRTEFAILFGLALAVSVMQIVGRLWLSPSQNVAMAVLLWPLTGLVPISASVRRLHDLDKTGWILVLAIVPVVGIVLLVWCFARPGTSGSNRYGSPRSAEIGVNRSPATP